ncbi:hypothetical protein Leryth_007703 [Lithospermum erythrorhizon]|nr:hypothetical protein Leryth_007703 [Lithospermum erythrorhizon]
MRKYNSHRYEHFQQRKLLRRWQIREMHWKSIHKFEIKVSCSISSGTSRKPYRRRERSQWLSRQEPR